MEQTAGFDAVRLGTAGEAVPAVPAPITNVDYDASHDAVPEDAAASVDTINKLCDTHPVQLANN